MQLFRFIPLTALGTYMSLVGKGTYMSLEREIYIYFL